MIIILKRDINNLPTAIVEKFTSNELNFLKFSYLKETFRTVFIVDNENLKFNSDTMLSLFDKVYLNKL